MFWDFFCALFWFCYCDCLEFKLPHTHTWTQKAYIRKRERGLGLQFRGAGGAKPVWALPAVSARCQRAARTHTHTHTHTDDANTICHRWEHLQLKVPLSPIVKVTRAREKIQLQILLGSSKVQLSWNNPTSCFGNFNFNICVRCHKADQFNPATKVIVKQAYDQTILFMGNIILSINQTNQNTVLFKLAANSD